MKIKIFLIGILLFSLFVAACDTELGHYDDHDHDGDGIQDHVAEDHDDEDYDDEDHAEENTEILAE